MAHILLKRDSHSHSTNWGAGGFMELERSNGVADDKFEIACREALLRRLHEITREVVRPARSGDVGPRWIEPAELIRRVRRFVSVN